MSTTDLTITNNDAPRAEHQRLQERERELAQKQQQWDEEVEEAQGIQNLIRRKIVDIHADVWELAGALYAWHDGFLWKKLGYETLKEWLAQPEIGLTKSWYETLHRCWYYFVVLRQVDPARLHSLEPSKVAEVLPAVRKGHFAADEALADVAVLGFRDLRKKYRLEKPHKTDEKPQAPAVTHQANEEPQPEDSAPTPSVFGEEDEPAPAAIAGELVDEFDSADPNVVTPEEAREELLVALNRDDPAPVSHATICFYLSVEV